MRLRLTLLPSSQHERTGSLGNVQGRDVAGNGPDVIICRCRGPVRIASRAALFACVHQPIH